MLLYHKLGFWVVHDVHLDLLRSWLRYLLLIYCCWAVVPFYFNFLMVNWTGECCFVSLLLVFFYLFVWLFCWYYCTTMLCRFMVLAMKKLRRKRVQLVVILTWRTTSSWNWNEWDKNTSILWNFHEWTHYAWCHLCCM